MKYLQIKIYVIQELHKNSGRAWIPLQNAVLRALEFQIKHIHSWCCWLYLGSSLAYFLAVFTCFHSQWKWIDIYFLANIQEVGNSNPRHISILYPTRMFPFTDHMALSTVFLANRPGRKTSHFSQLPTFILQPPGSWEMFRSLLFRSARDESPVLDEDSLLPHCFSFLSFYGFYSYCLLICVSLEIWI